MAAGSGGESRDPSWGFESRWIHTCLHGSRGRLLAVTAVGEAAATRTIAAAVADSRGQGGAGVDPAGGGAGDGGGAAAGGEGGGRGGGAGLQAELEAERASAETAASEAMLMIERLQREKADAQMEACQFRRYAEGRADREREVQDELASLSDLAASYLSGLRRDCADWDWVVIPEAVLAG